MDNSILRVTFIQIFVDLKGSMYFDGRREGDKQIERVEERDRVKERKKKTNRQNGRKREKILP